MIRERKVSTFYHRSGITLIPFILSLVIMLVAFYPGQSESAEKQLMNTSQRTVTEFNKGDGATKIAKISIYQKTIANVKRLFTSPKQSQSEESKSRQSYVTAQSDLVGTKTSEGDTGISPNKDNIYDILISVVKHQKVIESMNEALIEKLSQKDDTITSLEYTEEVLWNQLEESENKYWNTATDKAYMEDALLAQLEESENKLWNTVTDKTYMEDVLLAQLEESENKLWNTVTDKTYMEDVLLAQLEESENKLWNTVTDKTYMEDVLLAQLEESENKLWNTATDKAYMEDTLLAQLEESENKYWASLTNNNSEYQNTKVLTDLLDLKDYVIKALEDKEKILKAQLENNKKKFREALVARDAQYQKAVKSVSSSIEPVFGYSPPPTEK